MTSRILKNVIRLIMLLLPFAVVLLLVVPPAQASAPIPSPPSFKASSFLLMDYTTGSIILEKHADKPLHPASLTKIMTAYIVFDELRNDRLALEDTVLISEKAWRTRGSRMFIEVGKQVQVDDLLHGLVVQSGNDAAVALAEHITGSEEAFAMLMNQQATKLGMQNTHFVNATGWPHENHVTSAKDLAILTRAMIENFPRHYQLHAVKSFTFNGIKQYNRNKLLWRDKSVDGVKTGHTEAAGYCLVTSALRDNTRLIAVVMGATGEKARADATAKLLNFGFRFYETRRLYKAGDELAKPRIWKGESQHVRLGVNDDIIVTLLRSDYQLLQAELAYSKQLTAPLQAGSPVGQLVINLNSDAVATQPLVALESIAKGNLWVRLIDSVRLMFQ